MEKASLFSKILFITLTLSFGLFLVPTHGLHWGPTQIHHESYNPAPIHDQETAYKVGRKIALSEVSDRELVDQVRFVSAQRSTTADFNQKMTQAGVESTAWRQMSGDIWIITFTGSFTPKHTLPGRKEKTIHNTFIVYIRASTGEILGVSMRNWQY